MLENSLLESSGRQKSRKPITVVVSTMVHIGAIGVVVLIPLIQTQAITAPPIDMSLWAPKAPVPIAIDVTTVRPRGQKYTQPDRNILIQPETIPAQIASTDKPIPAPDYLPAVQPTDRVGDLLVQLINSKTETAVIPLAPPPPAPAIPAPPPAPADIAPVRRGGVVQQANLIYQVNPVYPELAKLTRVQGVVMMEAIISKEGAIESLRVLTGHPLLDRAAMDAVKQWRYRPTFLNGEPVEVITTITVTFSLH
jgi:periplasmic protein TonB